MQENRESRELNEQLTDAEIARSICYLDPDSCAEKSGGRHRHACRDWHQLVYGVNKRSDLHRPLCSGTVKVQACADRFSEAPSTVDMRDGKPFRTSSPSDIERSR